MEPENIVLNNLQIQFYDIDIFDEPISTVYFFKTYKSFYPNAIYYTSDKIKDHRRISKDKDQVHIESFLDTKINAVNHINEFLTTRTLFHYAIGLVKHYNQYGFFIEYNDCPICIESQYSCRKCYRLYTKGDEFHAF